MAERETPVEDWMLIGTVAAPMGIRGELKIDLATDFPDRFKRTKTVYLGEEHLPMAVEGARHHTGRILLRLAGVADRTAAEGLRGKNLYVPRSEAVPLPEGQYYYDQIVGLRAVTTGGEPLGTVEQVLRTGSNDVYVVRDGDREVLIPAIHDVVKQIDLEAGAMIVEPIEGLL